MVRPRDRVSDRAHHPAACRAAGRRRLGPLHVQVDRDAEPRVYPFAERPDVEAFVREDWLVGEPRMWKPVGEDDWGLRSSAAGRTEQAADRRLRPGRRAARLRTHRGRRHRTDTRTPPAPGDDATQWRDPRRSLRSLVMRTWLTGPTPRSVRACLAH